MTGSLTVGSEVAGYRIESMVGRGGMAVVYRAEDVRLGRKVAVKLLAPELSQHEQFRQRFVRESRLAASLDHPNIIPIYEAGDADGVLYIVMRYVAGSDLKVVLERDRPLDAERTLRLFAQIGDALDAAHMLGLVHRDVKPGNVLIAPTAEHGEHVYLTDFGLTKRTSSLSGLTGTGHFLGTIDYVAPEQISAKPVEPRTDIYAMGCMLYECLTGELPFHREDDAAMLWAHLVESPPPVSALRPDLPADVDDVVARAMAKAPEDRYETCRLLMLDLQDALGIAPAAPVPRQRPETERRPAAESHPSFPPGAYDPRNDVYADEPESFALAETPVVPVRRRRWPIALAAGLAAVVAVATVLLLNAGGGTTLSAHFTKNTIVPFSFDHPASWGEHDAGVDVVFSPAAGQVGPLFTSKGAGDTWAATRGELSRRSGDVVGLFTLFTATEIDNSSASALQAALQPLLPADAAFDSGDRKVVVDGLAADQLTGVLSDPASGAALRFVTYVVQVPQQSMSVQLTFFSPPEKFDQNRGLFDRVVRTVDFG